MSMQSITNDDLPGVAGSVSAPTSDDYPRPVHLDMVADTVEGDSVGQLTVYIWEDEESRTDELREVAQTLRSRYVFPQLAVLPTEFRDNHGLTLSREEVFGVIWLMATGMYDDDD